MTDTATETTPQQQAVVAEQSRTPHLTREGTHVWMVNTETNGLWECPIDYSDIALHDGWEFAEDPDASAIGTTVADRLAALALETAPEQSSEQTFFDPKDHTVQEVDAYVASMQKDTPGEAARVLAMERDGKARSSVQDPFDSGSAGNN